MQRATCHWVLWAALGAGACGARPERREHIVVPPITAEISERFQAEDAPPIPEQAACPMAVEGADVLLVPVKGGNALVFTTALASPLEVRRRAWYFAGLYDADGSPLPGLQPPEASPAGFPTSAQYSEVAAGARVEIRPLSAQHLPALREHLDRRLAHMRRTGSC